MKYNDLKDAFDFKKCTEFSNDEIILNIKSGKSFPARDSSDIDNDFNRDDFDSENYISVPDRRELNLGTRLVYKYAEEMYPEMYDQIRYIFSKEKAYSNFKNLLVKNNRLSEWRTFENEQTEKVLRKWAKEKSIELED